MKKLFKFTAYLLLLGIIHTGLTPAFYNSLSPDAMWFAGTGLALIFLALLNIVTERVFEQWAFNICITANVIGCLYSVLVVIALPETQAYTSLGIFLAVTGLSILVRPKTQVSL